jgi:hypothetical protein
MTLPERALRKPDPAQLVLSLVDNEVRYGDTVYVDMLGEPMPCDGRCRDYWACPGHSNTRADYLSGPLLALDTDGVTIDLKSVEPHKSRYRASRPMRGGQTFIPWQFLYFIGPEYAWNKWNSRRTA